MKYVVVNHVINHRNLCPQVSVRFSGNNAIVGSAVYTNLMDLCSWSSYQPPYFDNTSSVFRWPFISYEYVHVFIELSIKYVCVLLECLYFIN